MCVAGRPRCGGEVYGHSAPFLALFICFELDLLQGIWIWKGLKCGVQVEIGFGGQRLNSLGISLLIGLPLKVLLNLNSPCSLILLKMVPLTLAKKQSKSESSNLFQIF